MQSDTSSTSMPSAAPPHLPVSNRRLCLSNVDGSRVPSVCGLPATDSVGSCVLGVCGPSETDAVPRMRACAGGSCVLGAHNPSVSLTTVSDPKADRVLSVRDPSGLALVTESCTVVVYRAYTTPRYF
ncbi:hypothetical protein BOTBODRAFT_66713 [Botryobasidium botryosum FD-172 SS1]|uniref:Uncharacterized protein n=1 Tax=Botryobasidium botryosum (strain FD-172 SS1) TaxID=930990 RepID=A0A067MNM4_BOTB1|nr:hypothetical protein BOTBODRAFT_66713 [Botryobasidium botryosum FD-172 SS1]